MIIKEFQNYEIIIDFSHLSLISIEDQNPIKGVAVAVGSFHVAIAHQNSIVKLNCIEKQTIDVRDTIYQTNVDNYLQLFTDFDTHIRQPSTWPGQYQYSPFQLYNSSSNNNNNTSNGSSSNTSDFLSGHLLFPSESIFETAAKLLFMSVKWSKSVPSFLQVSV